MEIKTIENFSSLPFNLEVDLKINELKTRLRNSDYTKHVLLTVSMNKKDISILFNFMNNEELTTAQIHLVEETGLMFFMTENQFGIADLNKMDLIELKKSLTFGFPERIQDSIIFDDEISAMSYSITGKFIDEVAIDPPTERTDFANYIEYNSPIFGKAKLKIE